MYADMTGSPDLEDNAFCPEARRVSDCAVLRQAGGQWWRVRPELQI